MSTFNLTLIDLSNDFLINYGFSSNDSSVSNFVQNILFSLAYTTYAKCTANIVGQNFTCGTTSYQDQNSLIGVKIQGVCIASSKKQYYGVKFIAVGY